MGHDKPQIHECLHPYSDGSGSRHCLTVLLTGDEDDERRIIIEANGSQIDFSAPQWANIVAAVERALDYYAKLPEAPNV